MRSLLFIALVATPTVAEDFVVTAPVTDVTLYGTGAVITQQAQIDLPAGQHRILVPANDQLLSYDLPKITLPDGLSLAGVAVIRGAVADPETVYLPEQTAAQAALEQAEEEVRLAQAALASTTARRTALQGQIEFLATASAGQITALSPEALLATVDVLGERRQALEEQLFALEGEMRPLEEAVENAELARAQVQINLDRLTPPRAPASLVAVNVQVAEAVAATISLESFTYAAGWLPEYDIFLERGDAPTLKIHRKASIRQNTGVPWTDVNIRLSTGNPLDRTAPSIIVPNKVQIGQPAPNKSSRLAAAPALMAEDSLAGRLHTEATEAAPAPVQSAAIVTEGDVITYEYAQPVTLASGPENLILALDALDFPATETIRAVPRFDETAYLMAEFTNSSAEPLLAGTANLFRDGARLALSQIDYVPAGAETELAFGKMEGLRLDWRLLQNDTGDRGLVSRSDTREQSLQFRIENLMAEAQEVQLIYALPFSEQEDLTVRARANPAPDLRDFEDDRGVAAWNLTLEPGQEQVIRVDVALTWPQGQPLFWQP
ncbi:MAG: mucoidy inhibitor MuiA family protein [Pseudomonadota bacterium]